MITLVALPGHERLAEQLGRSLGAERVRAKVHRFPDGEERVQLEADAFAGDVAIVGNLVHDRFLGAAFLAGTARDLGAERVGMVAPYLAYMRQDARFRPGEGVSAAYFGRLVSGVFDWLVTVDPHLHRLDALDRVYSIPTAIARAAPAIARWIEREVAKPVLVGPDAESVQWVSAVAEQLRHRETPFVILEKTRRGDRDVSVSAPDRVWNGHTPVVIDDIISTGRTMVEATRQLCHAGSAPPICIAIHAVFADAVQEDLVSAGAAGLVTCDTIAHASNRIEVIDAIAIACEKFVR